MCRGGACPTAAAGQVIAGKLKVGLGLIRFDRVGLRIRDPTITADIQVIVVVSDKRGSAGPAPGKFKVGLGLTAVGQA